MMRYSILVQIEANSNDLQGIKECLGMAVEQYGYPRVVLVGASGGTQEELYEQLKVWGD